MDPKERLKNGRKAASDGRYEGALREYIRFHEHALEHDPALYGVRQSFALADWINLAKVYPEARHALEAIRDSKTARLLRGDGDRAAFHDVARINEHLKCEQSTSDLFAKLATDTPELASECAGLALPALVSVGEFQLARRYVPKPAEALQRFAKTLNEDVDDLARDSASATARLDAYVHIYAQRVAVFLALLRGVGDSEEAERIEASALEMVGSPSVRDAVRAALGQFA